MVDKEKGLYDISVSGIPAKHRDFYVYKLRFVPVQGKPFSTLSLRNFADPDPILLERMVFHCNGELQFSLLDSHDDCSTNCKV